MRILARNWRCRYGELDLIAAHREVTAFVEVKTRTGLAYGVPAEAVTYTKQQRIRRTALSWLAQQQGSAPQIRFDVVAVVLRRGYRPVVEHLAGVF